MRTLIISAIVWVLSFFALMATGEGGISVIVTVAFFGMIAGAVMWVVGASRRRREEMDLLRQIAAQGKQPE